MIGLFELSAAMQWYQHALIVERAMLHQQGDDCGALFWGVDCAICSLRLARIQQRGEEFYT